MTAGRDLRDLLGDDVPDPELERLAAVDEILSATPPPPGVPAPLTARVLAIPGAERGGSRWRFAAALGAAAALAAGIFGVGLWVGGNDEARIVDEATLVATPAGPAEAGMLISVLPIDDAGNWAMAAEVWGLPQLPAGGYYEVWMTQEGRAVASCGRFIVDETGQAHGVWLNAPYEFGDYDRWVVTAQIPGEPRSEWLLDGPVTRI